jgi:hypothetical protein
VPSVEHRAHHPDNLMKSTPENTGAAVIPLGKHWDVDHDDPTSRPSGHRKDARRPRRNVHRRPVRLCDSGALVGFAHMDVPQWAHLGANRYERESLSLVAPNGEIGALAEVADEDVGSRERCEVSGCITDDGYRPSPLC